MSSLSSASCGSCVSTRGACFVGVSVPRQSEKSPKAAIKVLQQPWTGCVECSLHVLLTTLSDAHGNVAALSKTVQKALKQMGPKTEELDLSGRTLNKNMFEAVAEFFPNLKKLNLSRTRFDNANLEILAKLKHIQEFDVRYTPITYAGLAALNPSAHKVVCTNCEYL